MAESENRDELPLHYTLSSRGELKRTIIKVVTLTIVMVIAAYLSDSVASTISPSGALYGNLLLLAVYATLIAYFAVSYLNIEESNSSPYTTLALENQYQAVRSTELDNQLKTAIIDKIKSSPMSLQEALEIARQGRFVLQKSEQQQRAYASTQE